MQHIVSILFIIEFLLIIYVFFRLLFKNGLTFRGGIAFALLFFIFIPIWVIIITGSIKLNKSDFGLTRIVHVVLAKEIKSSFLFIGYIFSIILYLYFPVKIFASYKQNMIFKPSIKSYLIIYTVCMMINFIGSGMLDGGNWYHNRHEFFDSHGSFAVLVAFVLNSSKILIITSLIYQWVSDHLKFKKFIIFVVSFTVIDMIFSGNRIYLFCTAIIIGMVILKKYTKTMLLLMPIILPSILFMGYFASIFRHMRGPLFEKGFPTLETFNTSFKRAMELDPITPKTFFLNISESVNVNVIYEVFNNYDNFLYGTTYLKSLVYYLPRSIWEGKPESITVIAADFLGGSSLVTTIIGEMFMNFSYFGMLFLPVFLWLTNGLLSYGLRTYSSISGIIMFFFGILFFRMPFSDEFLVFVFLVIILKSLNVFKKYKFTIK